MVSMNDVMHTTEAKYNFLKAIIRVARSDNVIAESEKRYIDEAAAAFSLPDEIMKTLNTLWEAATIPVSFDTDREKMFTLIQLIQLSWIDGEYQGEEKTEIRKIARELSISDDAVKTVEAWVAEGIEWTKRGDLLLALS